MGVTLIEEFDLLRPGYAGAQVTIYVAGTNALAQVFTDVELTEAADNPQYLTSVTDGDGNTYGRFEASIYTDQAYELEIDGATLTGARYPVIPDLEGEDASDATVITVEMICGDIASNGTTQSYALIQFADSLFSGSLT